MKTLSLILLFLTSFFIRAVRWLAIVQQKEYRLDRLWLFLKSTEGRKELIRLIPKKKDFSRTGLKRPKITARVLLVSGIFAFQFILLILFISIPFSDLFVSLLVVASKFVGLLAILYIILGLLIFLFIIPLLVITSILPTTIVSSTKIYLELLKAKRKVNKVKPIIIGITGSYGKTSTKILLSKVLEKKYSVFKTPKSYNTKFSVAKSINQGFKDQKVMILEYAAYKKKEIKVLASWFKPNLVIITGLAKQHLGLFGSLKAIINAKAELIEGLAFGSKVICNGADPGAIRICERGIELQSQSGSKSHSSKNLEIIKAGSDNKDLAFTKVSLDELGKLAFSWNAHQVKTNFIGQHYLEVIRMVILAAKQFDVSEAQIAEVISEFIPGEKFINSYFTESGSYLINDGGTSNPKGFKAAINLAKAVKKDRKILITAGIVDLGGESDIIHRELAKQAVKVFDTVIHAGEDGANEFKEVFESKGKKFLSGQKQISEFLSQVKKEELILIEGFIPSWLKSYLK